MRIRLPLGITLALLVVAACPADGKESWSGRVVKVADGDTITVLRGKERVRIRLHGVDTPEKAQPFGQKAKRFTTDLVAGKQVRVRPVTRDRYGRTVAEVFVGDKSLSEALVQAGLAWWYRRYAKRAKVLAVLEEEARQARRGLWADPSPVAPWTFRHRGRPYHGNVKSRVFHAPHCQHYNCKSCTVTFKTARAAVAAGYRPHRACVKSVGPQRPPGPDNERSCTSDRDCVIAWDPCGYRNPPCSDALKPAVNRAAARRKQARWANRKPDCSPHLLCKGTPGRWLGSRAACVKGMCVTQR